MSILLSQSATPPCKEYPLTYQQANFQEIHYIVGLFLAKFRFQDCSRLSRKAASVDDIQSHRGEDIFQIQRLAIQTRLSEPFAQHICNALDRWDQIEHGLSRKEGIECTSP